MSPRASLAWEDKGGQDVPWFCPIMCFPLVVLQSDIVLKVKLEKLNILDSSRATKQERNLELYMVCLHGLRAGQGPSVVPALTLCLACCHGLGALLHPERAVEVLCAPVMVKQALPSSPESPVPRGLPARPGL